MTVILVSSSALSRGDEHAGPMYKAELADCQSVGRREFEFDLVLID